MLRKICEATIFVKRLADEERHYSLQNEGVVDKIPAC